MDPITLLIIGSIIAAGGSLISSGLNAKSQSDSNQTNIDLANLTNAFNASEAQKQRDFEHEEGQITRDFNASEAEKSRNWSTEMSNTAIQRTMADAKEAGINPIAAILGSGTNPISAGATASSSAVHGSAASGVKANVNPVYFDITGATDSIARICNTAGMIGALKGSDLGRIAIKLTKYTSGARQADMMSKMLKA